MSYHLYRRECLAKGMALGRSEDMRWQLPHITKDIDGLMKKYEVRRTCVHESSYTEPGKGHIGSHFHCRLYFSSCTLAQSMGSFPRVRRSYTPNMHVLMCEPLDWVQQSSMHSPTPSRPTFSLFYPGRSLMALRALSLPLSTRSMPQNPLYG